MILRTLHILLSPFNSIQINYQIDDVPFEYSYKGTIAVNEVKQIEIPNNPNISIGEHKLVVETSVKNDAFTNNNRLKTSFTSNNTGEAQYVNTFGDINEDRWLTITLGESNNLWEKSEAGSNEYDDNVSDHRPVLWKFTP